MTSGRTVLAIVLGLSAVVFALYWPTLHYQFILDDHRFTSDPRIQDSDHVWEYFTSFVWAQFTGGPPSFYRPLFLLWMRINFLVSGLSPLGWHLLSIAKHALVASLLALVVYRLLCDRMAALLAATLFALHPAQAESVAWVTVPDALFSAGILGALLLYLRYGARSAAQRQGQVKPRKTKSRNQAPRAGVWLFASAAAFLAALLTKETAIIFPVVIFCLEFLHSRGTRRAQKMQQRQGTGVLLLTAIRRTAPFLVATGLYLVLRLNALSGKLAATTQHLPARTLVLSGPRIIWFYLKVMFWPTRSYSFADPILEQVFSVRAFLLPASVLLAAIGLTSASVVWIHRSAHRELSAQQAEGVDDALTLGFTLLVLPLLLCLNLNALNPGDFLHGRYTYLPLSGLGIVVATAWMLAGRLRVPLLWAAGGVAVVFALLTFSQEQQWKDDLTVFTVAHQLAPHNAPVARNLADARVREALLRVDEDRCQEAMPVFEQVARDYPEDWYAWGAIGDCFVQVNNLSKAEEAMHRAADLSHDSRIVQQWQELRQHMGLPAGVLGQ